MGQATQNNSDYCEQHSLVGQLLIAMPGMSDPNFSYSVTYICEHSEKGALGIIVNQPMKLNIGQVFEQLDLPTETNNKLQQPVLRGGPVQAERGFVLHESELEWDATSEVSESIFVTTSQDILSSIAAGRGPNRVQLALGYAGWGAGQLENEILNNAWLHVPAKPELIFDTPFEQRWQAAAASIGVDVASLSMQAGHA